MNTDTSQILMELAEALTDATRSLDRTRRRVETIESILQRLPNDELRQNHITACRSGVVMLQQLNNTIRKMLT